MYLAVGSNTKPTPKRKKSKIFPEHRQQTSKTDNVINRAGGDFIRKITQRTNTKFSNFSEFPTPIQEKQVKLNQHKKDELSKLRSRTVKRRFKNTSKSKGKKNTKKLKYYNIITDLQRKPKVSPRKLCWDFCNSEIVNSNVPQSVLSNLAISKYEKTDSDSVIPEEDIVFSASKKLDGQIAPNTYGNIRSKNMYQNSKYTKTDATRTDTKSLKQTYSRENSLSSNRSNWFSKMQSLPRHPTNQSKSSK